MTYRVAEKFKSIQGEGLYTGTPMAFIRFVGCSVGKKICHACDTDFDQTMPWRGGGEFSAQDLNTWAEEYHHICLTGGEPLDQDLLPLRELMQTRGRMLHIETSGTKPFWKIPDDEESLWVCVSPKPGFIEDIVQRADEIKVIVPGLGDDRSLISLLAETRKKGASYCSQAAEAINSKDDTHTFRWPTLVDALRWANDGKLVYIQPRNGKFDIDQNNLRLVQDIIAEYPQLRLSTQFHKILKVQ